MINQSRLLNNFRHSNCGSSNERIIPWEALHESISIKLRIIVKWELKGLCF